MEGIRFERAMYGTSAAAIAGLALPAVAARAVRSRPAGKKMMNVRILTISPHPCAV